MDDPNGYGLTAIVAAVSAILGIGLTKGVDAIIRLRKSSEEAEAHGEERVLGGWQKMVVELTARITATEDDLRHSHRDHLQCVRDHATLLERVTNQDVAIRKLEMRLERYEKGNP